MILIMRRYIVLIILSFVSLASCTSQKPEPMDYNHDSCSHCKMVISDRRFGAEIVTAKGKVYKFDSLECSQSFETAQAEKIGSGAKHYVVNTTKPGAFVLVEDAFYFIDPKVRSPMGLGIMAADSADDLKKTVGEDKTSQFIRWNDLKPKLTTIQWNK